jgi:hypothetical protein
LPRDAQVRLDVFDLRGRRVAKLVDGTLPAGEHQRAFAADRLPGGLYVYRLVVAGRPHVGKMLLVK